MWCYQKPGFEALLLAELQRQQQNSQFCDTLLKSEGVSVPAHSCVLSALSPRMSSALSSAQASATATGQSRLLEFRALGACTLLRMVRLLYSGQMAGRGEKEKEEAMSAAAELGIHGLVEVTDKDRQDKEHQKEDGQSKAEVQCAEIGVQTEPEENDRVTRGRWRREVRDGNTFLWKETLSGGEEDTHRLTSGTQTEEEVHVNAAPLPPPPPAVSYDTIDMNALQSLAPTDHQQQVLPPQIPYIPVSFVYPPEEDHAHAAHTDVAAFASPPYTSASSFAPPFSTSNPETWEYDDRLEQFEGNIPGYISYFLNPDKEENPRGGRARRARRARGAGTGTRRTRKPRTRTAGRGRGRGSYTQTVDVQDVGLGKAQKLFLQRSGARSSRPGQGGGATGRKLFMKTRDTLKPAKGARGRKRGIVWELSESGDVIEGPPLTRKRNAAQQINQVPAGQSQGARLTPATSVSYSSPPVRFFSGHPLSACSPGLQHSPSPVAPYVPRAARSLRPRAPPSPSPGPEHIDRLLEEVMMGLDILPAAQPPHPTAFASSKQNGGSSGLSEATPGSPRVVVAPGGACGSDSPRDDGPVLHQPEEGELNDMLENFLQSFERHVDGCATREPVDQSRSDENLLFNSRRSKAQTVTVPHRGRSRTIPRVRRSRITGCDTSPQPQRSSAPPKPSGGTPGRAGVITRPVVRKRRNRHPPWSNQKKVTVRSRGGAKKKTADDRVDRQLQQIPVVKLERSGFMPVKVTLQSQSCCSLDIKSRAKIKRTSLAEKYRQDIMKMYPIRSRIKDGHIRATASFRQEVRKDNQSGRRRGRPRKNGPLPSSLNNTISSPRINPQPVQPRGTKEQLDKTQQRHGATRGRKKRGLESEEETNRDASVAKMGCFEQTVEPASETVFVSKRATALETEEDIDIEGVFTTSVGERSQREERETWSDIKLREFRENLLRDVEMQSSGDETINVEDDAEEDTRFSRTPQTLSRLVSNTCVSLGSTGSCEEDRDEDRDEDIDVIGGSSPVPDPVSIDWADCSEEEEDEVEVDVVGEKADCAPSAVFISMSKGEFVNRKYQNEMLLR